MRLNLSLTQKGLLLVSVPLVCEIGFVAYLWGLVEKADVEIKRQEHARELLTHMNSLTRKLVEAGTTAGSYSCPIFLGHYADVLATTTTEFRALEDLTRDNPSEFRTVKQVELLADEGVSLVRQGRSLLKQGQEGPANELLVTSLKPLIQRLSAETELLTNEAQHDSDRGPEARARMQNQVRYTLIGGIGFNILVAFSLAIFFMKNISRNVALVMDNTFRLARRQPFNPPLTGTDEIAHLDGVLREMAKALEIANHKERTIFENARDMICTIAGGGVLANVSPASADILGYAPEELEGRWIVELVSEQDVSRTIELLKKLLKGDDNQSFELRMKHKDGKIVDLLWSAQWSQEENCLFCVAHEITERKVAEELLRTSEARTRSILETAPVGIIALDTNGVFQLGNPAVATMFGLDLADIGSLTLHDVMQVAKEKPAEQFLDDCLNKTLVLEGRRKSGHLFPAEITVKQLESISGRQYLMVVLDITERQEIERLKQDFVAMVSHELRTPLTSVQGFLDLLSVDGYGTITDRAKSKCDVASRNVSRLIDLINDILDAEKMESGKFEFRFSEISMQRVISKSLDAVRDFADKSGVAIEINPGDGSTIADQERIVQVIINLLSNAIKFSPKGSTVVLTVEETPRYIEVSVTDCGVGIPPEFQHTVFERFSQITGGSKKHKGSGLGLMISRKIIEQHNGQIGVESTEGKGSRFWFRLPTIMNPVAVQ